MATDEKGEALDATEEEWQEEDEDRTLGEGIVPYEGGIAPRAQWDLAEAFTGFRGAMLWVPTATGPMPALYYDIPNRGSGLTARAMRILSAMRGGFDELDITVSQGEAFVAVPEGDGKWGVETIPAVEAKVRVRDLMAGNVRIGYWVEPLVKQRKDGSYYPVPDPRGIAVAKARRNAYGEHFAGAVDTLLQAFRAECAQKRQHFSGAVPKHVAEASLAVSGEFANPQQVREAVAAVPLGVDAKNEIQDQLRELGEKFGTDLVPDFLAWGAATFGTQKVATWPARRRAEVNQWIGQKAATLAEKLVGSDERPSDSEGTQPETPLANNPTDIDVRERLKTLTKEQAASAYQTAGVKLTSPLGPDECARLWAAMDGLSA